VNSYNGTDKNSTIVLYIEETLTLLKDSGIFVISYLLIAQTSTPIELTFSYLSNIYRSIKQLFKLLTISLTLLNQLLIVLQQINAQLG